MDANLNLMSETMEQCFTKQRESRDGLIERFSAFMHDGEDVADDCEEAIEEVMTRFVAELTLATAEAMGALDALALAHGYVATKFADKELEEPAGHWKDMALALRTASEMAGSTAGMQTTVKGSFLERA